MSSIKYNDKTYQTKANESLLNLFIRLGVNVPFSCKAGVCQTCMMQTLEGEVPKESQKGLSEEEINDAKFLPCLCHPTKDLEVCPLPEPKAFKNAQLLSKEYINPSIIKLVLKPESHFFFHGGQFINIKNSNGIIRSYSIANKQNHDSIIELHIKLIKNGVMSNWINNELKIGDLVNIQGPIGNCHYQGEVNKDLLLIGSGTGLAPLVGIVQEALNKNHLAKISLFHSAKSDQNIYMHKELKQLASEHSNLHYHASVTNNESTTYPVGDAVDFAFGSMGDLSNWLIYLCGNPELVYKGQSQSLANGADPQAVFYDAFISPDVDKSDPATHYDEGDTYPEPDSKIWEELQNGILLKRILSDFYEVVYEDELLAPYFTEVSKQHVASKQYSFLYKAFTGEDVYFGDRPRNAHHWMVITNEIFDYREDLFERILRQNKISESLIKTFREIHEQYRPYIVKEKPWPKIIQGITQPIDGFDKIELELDYFCSVCEIELLKGSNVLYHKGSGEIYCDECSQNQE